MSHGGPHSVEASEVPMDAPDFGEESPWRGFDEIDYDRTTYGVGMGGQAYVLAPGHIEIDENGIIPTDNFMLPLAGQDAELKGFIAVDPDENPETVEGLGLQSPGLSSGYRGGNAQTNEQGEIVGESQSAIDFVGDTTLAPATMGVGFVVLTTTHEGFNQSSKMFFTYSNLDQEPKFRATNRDHVDIGDNSITYRVPNPLDYSEAESVGLRAKFGWDPTLGTGTYTNPYMDGIERSVNKIVEALNASYPINLTTFPRTPPMKIQRKHISKIRKREKGETEATSGTTPLETNTDSSY